MTLRDIFNSIIDYDLSGLIDIGLIILAVIIVIVAMIWLVFRIREIIQEFKEYPIASSFRLLFVVIALFAIPASVIILALP
tara:strand:+ start:1642 stop:1884 length:243 start_codon:yes stop_codon:yes gene_type:complete